MVSTKFLARTTRNPYRISFVSVLDHRSILYSPASFLNSDHARSWSSRPRLASRGTGASASITSSSPYFTACSEILSSTSTWLSRRRQYERRRLPRRLTACDSRAPLARRRRAPRVDVVAMAGEQELEVEGRESSEAGFVERLRVDLRLGLGEEFIVVLPENRALRATASRR